MSNPVDRKHRQNTEILRTFYRRPAVRSCVRLFQKVFDERYWKREQALARKAESLDRQLSLACQRIFRKADINGLSVTYPRVVPAFDSRALLALRQLLGITRDDQRITTALIWFKWLVRNWDLEKDPVPKLPKEILDIQPQLRLYIFSAMPLPKLPSDQEVDRPWHLNSWVTARFFPGVSHRDLQECMDQVYKLANAQSDGKGVRLSKGGAPSRLTGSEWEEAFLKFGRVVNGVSPRLPRIQEYIKNKYGQHYSVSQIRARYEKFLKSRPEYLSVR